MFDISLFYYQLKFKRTFNLAHGSRDFTELVYVKISDGKNSGLGEIALPPYLGVTVEHVVNFFRNLDIQSNILSDHNSLMAFLNNIAKTCLPGLAGLDMALHDLLGKKVKLPVYRFYSLSAALNKSTMITLSPTNGDQMKQYFDENPDAEFYKIKFSNDKEKELIKSYREISDKPFGVDVNEGWNNKERAIELVHFLQESGVVFIEQPFPKARIKEQEWLFERSDLPLIADESFQKKDDLDEVGKYFHGINIKLMKCGGILPAFNILKAAKDKKLKILVGCMSESSAGISAAAQLASMVDWIDLDGPILTANDPVNGILEGIELNFNNKPGLGIEFRSADELKLEKLL